MNAFLKWLDKAETVNSYSAMHENINSFIERANAAFKEEGYPIKLTNWFSVWSILYTQPGRYHWMFQFYLKDAGVNMSWVGTGRLLVACGEMKNGGWWEPPVTNIKKKLAIE